ncbi:MAG: cytochrome c oxidase subunit II [Gammaproteobacteria bacterium]
MLVSGLAAADLQLNMKPGVTSFSQGAYEIHTMVMWICVVIGIVVFGAMIYSIVKHRKSKGAVPASFHENTTVEVVWTVIPFLILIAMAIPATKVLLAMEDTSNSDMSIKVTGYQWKWHYDYLGEDVSFFSNLTTPIEQIKGEAEKTDNYLLEVDNKLVIPTNKKVRLLFTSNDVIHAWWVPAFGVKKDSIPGFINESWVEVSEPGIYRGKCAELCGQNHGFMPVVVEVKSEEDYVAWLNTKKALAAEEAASADKTYTQAELMAQGEKVYKTACAACHQVNGEGLPPMFPGLKGSAVAMGDIAKHIDIIINGVSGTAMQAFGAQLNDADIAAVVTYERNAWGNDTGDVTQPADIKAAR